MQTTVRNWFVLKMHTVVRQEPYSGGIFFQQYLLTDHCLVHTLRFRRKAVDSRNFTFFFFANMPGLNVWHQRYLWRVPELINATDARKSFTSSTTKFAFLFQGDEKRLPCLMTETGEKSISSSKIGSADNVWNVWSLNQRTWVPICRWTKRRRIRRNLTACWKWVRNGFICWCQMPIHLVNVDFIMQAIMIYGSKDTCWVVKDITSIFGCKNGAFGNKPFRCWRSKQSVPFSFINQFNQWVVENCADGLAQS